MKRTKSVTLSLVILLSMMLSMFSTVGQASAASGFSVGTIGTHNNVDCNNPDDIAANLNTAKEQCDIKERNQNIQVEQLQPCTVKNTLLRDPYAYITVSDDAGNEVRDWGRRFRQYESLTVDFSSLQSSVVHSRNIWVAPNANWYADISLDLNNDCYDEPATPETPESPAEPERWVKPPAPSNPCLTCIKRFREEPGWGEDALPDERVLLSMSFYSPTPFNPYWVSDDGIGWHTGMTEDFNAKGRVPYSLVWDSIAHPATPGDIEGTYNFYENPPTRDFIIIAGLVKGPVDWSKVERFRDVYGYNSVAKFGPCSDSIWIGDLIGSEGALRLKTDRTGINSWEAGQFMLENFRLTDSNTSLMAANDAEINAQVAELAAIAMDEGSVEIPNNWVLIQ